MYHPGKGKAAIQEAKKMLECDEVDYIRCAAGGPHWNPALVGGNEAMTPTVCGEPVCLSECSCGRNACQHVNSPVGGYHFI